MALLDKIIEIVTSRPMAIPPTSFNGSLHICGYPMDDIIHSTELQRKVYALLTHAPVPCRITPASLRTMAVGDIRSGV